MVGEDRFDPRLRLDLSSGKGSLRGLTDSIDHLNKSENIRMLPPRPPYVDPDAPPGVDYERAIGLVHGRHTQDMHDRHAAMLHKICQQNAGGVHAHMDAGMNIATTVVLFMNALSPAAGNNTRSWACRNLEGWPSKRWASH